MKTTGHRCAQIRTIRALVLILALLALTVFANGQTILYVDDDAPDGGDGLSWNTAFNDLQDALDVGPGKGTVEIRVGQGLYVPTSRIDPTDARSVTFQLASNTTLEGGYGGLGRDDPDDRDVTKYKSLLSGDLAYDDQPGFNNISENACHVLLCELKTNVTIDGLYIEAGNADISNMTPSWGGGILNRSSSPTIRNCHFAQNKAQFGGAIFNDEGASPQIEDCTFADNLGDWGTGIYNYHKSDPTITQCSFVGNHAESGGCAIMNYGTSSPIIKNCEFISNTSIGGGTVRYGWHPEKEPPGYCYIEHSTFSSNFTDGSGAGIRGQIAGGYVRGLYVYRQRCSPCIRRLIS
jgi:hypothetical protein